LAEEINSQKPICIIPARLGSKRLLRKNIIDFLGKPLLGHSIDVARESGVFSRVVVSTESKEIAGVAREFGAEVPFLRNPELADDFSTMEQVTLDHFEKETLQRELPPTGAMMSNTLALRTIEDIRQAWNLFNSANADYLVTVRALSKSPYAILIKQGHRVAPILGQEKMRIPFKGSFFRNVGGLYLFKVNAFLKDRTFFGRNLVAYEMPQERCIDIDTEADLIMARALAGHLGLFHGN
jgi:pseudaminic acid cytidylyltransferase